MPDRFWIETLGCPKNQVDSDKLVGTMLADGLEPAESVDSADVVVINTCAFVEEARQESIDTILQFENAKKPEAKVVVTGCMAERYGPELAESMPEIDQVAGFGVPVTLGATRRTSAPSFDLLDLPRPASAAPWAYVKVAEGCDRACGFCAIPSFRGPQRSRSIDSILAEVESLGAQEIVLVAQDLAAFGRDQGQGDRRIVPLVEAVAARVPWVRLLYLYPSDLTENLISVILSTGVPYFDLSLQHVSRPLLRRMRRWGDGERFAERIAHIRALDSQAVFRSNFIVGYPGETEDDHDQLLRFVEEVRLDWCGFFPYSEEAGTYGADLEPKVPSSLRNDRLAELRELQDSITAQTRDERIGTEALILVDRPGVGRSVGEAPEIDGVIRFDQSSETVKPGDFARVLIEGAEGPDLIGGPATVQALSANSGVAAP